MKEESWGESKGLSAEIQQSAAAGLLWLSEGKGDCCGNVAGNTARLHKLVTHPLNFVGQGRLTSTPEHYGTCCYCHVKLGVRLLDVVKQTAVKEGLNAADGPNIVLVFPSLDEGNEPGGVQM